MLSEIKRKFGKRADCMKVCRHNLALLNMVIKPLLS